MAMIPTKLIINEQLNKRSMESADDPELEIPQYSNDTIEAMKEAGVLSKDPSTKRYQSFSGVLEDLDV